MAKPFSRTRRQSFRGADKYKPQRQNENQIETFSSYGFALPYQERLCPLSEYLSLYFQEGRSDCWRWKCPEGNLMSFLRVLARRLKHVDTLLNKIT
jgi:hypothetical protein